MAAGRIMLEEARRHGYYEEFLPELEYSFTQLFYVNTLFTYMACAGRTKSGFVRALGREMRRTFPRFQDNPYYLERTNVEERKLIRIQQSSTLLFIAYYKMLWAYRGFRRKRQRQGT